MTEQEKKIKKYVNAIEKRLCLPLEMKARINADLGTDIHARLEEGKGIDEILAEIGTPEEVAKHFNSEMEVETIQAGKPVKMLFLLAAVLGIVGIMWNFPLWKIAIDFMGSGDGPTSIFIAGRILLSPFEQLFFGTAYFLGLISAYYLSCNGRKRKQKLYKRCVLISTLGVVAAVGGWIFIWTHLLSEGPTAEGLFTGILIVQIWIPTILSVVTLFISIVFYRSATHTTRCQEDAASKD